jgi:hypothetical protein
MPRQLLPTFEISVNGTKTLFAAVTESLGGGVGHYQLLQNVPGWSSLCGAVATEIPRIPEGLQTVGTITCETLIDDEAVRAVITFYGNATTRTGLSDIEGRFFLDSASTLFRFFLDSASTLFQCIFDKSYSVCPYPTPERTRDLLIVLGTVVGAALILVIGCIIYHVGLPPCPPLPRPPGIGFFRLPAGAEPRHVELAPIAGRAGAAAGAGGGEPPARAPTPPAGIASEGGGSGGSGTSPDTPAAPSDESQHAHLLSATPR